MKLYTYQINIDTLEVESDFEKFDDYPKESAGYASYEESLEGNRVYAESLKSVNDARELVYNFCMKFYKAGMEILHVEKCEKEGREPCDCHKNEQICNCY